MAEQPQKQGGSLALMAILGLVGSMIPALLILLFIQTCEDPVMKRSYRKAKERQEKTEEVEREIVQQERAIEKTPEKEDVFLTLEEGLLALAPGIYLSVRFLHEDGHALSPNELEHAEGVHTIEITVKSEPWDELEPKNRVDLLNKTFKFIKDRFPDMTKFLRLAYDDGRPAFDMKFGAEI